MALIYNPNDLRLLRSGATINPPKGTYKYDIHPRVHNIDGLMTKVYEELAALDAGATGLAALIAANTAAIAVNVTSITTNATNITTNATNIATNTTSITTNTGNISALTITVATNTTNIATNATNIATNVTNIATNTTNIATNTTNITTNTTNITTNAAAIAAIPGPVVLYVLTLTELKDAFDYFNGITTATYGASPGIKAGIIKMANSMNMDADLTLDFGSGIELWGAENVLYSTTSRWKVIVHGVRAVFRNLYFGGDINTAVDTDLRAQEILEIDDITMQTLYLDVCGFSSVNGTNNADYTAGSGHTDPGDTYNIVFTNMATDFVIYMVGTRISTGATGSGVKHIGAFRMILNKSINGFRVICRDWLNSYGAKDSLSDRNIWKKMGNVLRLDRGVGISQPVYKHEFMYDQTVMWDPASGVPTTPGVANPSAYTDWGSWLDWLPTFYGPTTRSNDALNGPTANIWTDPTNGGVPANTVYGNPGDVMIISGDIYMRHTNQGYDSAGWSKIN